MGSRERRSRERTETRQKILDTARDMFVRRGYDATTMRAIAERIEYTPTAIYHHFRSKEALLTELCNTDFRALASAFQRIGTIEDPAERLRRVGQAYVEFAIEHPMHYQLMFMTPRPAVTTNLASAREDASQDAYAFLRSTCEDLVASGLLRPDYDDPEQVAQIAWSSLHGIISLQIVKANDPWIEWRDLRQTTAKLCDALLKGMLRHEAR